MTKKFSLNLKTSIKEIIKHFSYARNYAKLATQDPLNELTCDKAKQF